MPFSDHEDVCISIQIFLGYNFIAPPQYALYMNSETWKWKPPGNWTQSVILCRLSIFLTFDFHLYDRASMELTNLYYTSSIIEHIQSTERATGVCLQRDFLANTISLRFVVNILIMAASFVILYTCADLRWKSETCRETTMSSHHSLG